MSKIPAVKGTRDFYPDIMAVRNWILDGWKAISRRNGFVEYDGPIFEYLQLFTQKSGEGIASELFSLTDRGGRDLAIRPEMTPTLARMVNQQINALPRPIKWFSLPRCCRAERPQKGRLREFFQWNVDIIGTDELLADAECIFTAVDYVRSVGLSSADVVVKLSSRAMLAAVLTSLGFGAEQLEGIYVLVDKRPKLPAETFDALCADAIADADLRGKLMALMETKNLDDVDALAQTDEARESIADLRQLFTYLEQLGIGDYCVFDISIVRGLAYYTGPVFEIHDRGGSLRAIAGGGRYDNLLAGLGGAQVSGTGFGMGDVVLELMLREKGLIDAEAGGLDVFVIDAGAECTAKALEIVAELRYQGVITGFDYRRTGMGKQLKQAASQKARYSLIVGQETLERQEVTVKDMGQGSQRVVTLADLLANPREALEG